MATIKTNLNTTKTDLKPTGLMMSDGTVMKIGNIQSGEALKLVGDTITGFNASESVGGGTISVVTGLSSIYQASYDVPTGQDTFRISFPEVYSPTPKIFGNISTTSGIGTYAFSISGIDTSGFSLCLSENNSDTNMSFDYLIVSGTGALTLPNGNKQTYNFITGTYTGTQGDSLIDCSGTFSLTMPNASGDAGRTIVIKNSAGGTVTLTGTNSQTFDGQTSLILSQYDATTLVSNNNNWVII